jgi:hypothetical protein
MKSTMHMKSTKKVDRELRTRVGIAGSRLGLWVATRLGLARRMRRQ